jgi:2-iminobutanoate/2-iminopropanoate deaminase
MLMTKVVVKPKDAPEPKGQYSHMVIGGPFIFFSGQLPLTPTGDLVAGNIEAQTRQVLENIRKMLQGAGSSLEKAVKIGVYITDIDDFEGMNRVYSEFFPKEPPARTTLIVNAFPAGIRIEIDGIALISEEG